MSPEIQINFHNIQERTIIKLAGKLTSFADDEINRSINTLYDTGISTIIMDFTNVSYINSAGLAILIGVLAELKNKDGRLIVYGLTPHFKKLFKLVGLSRFIDIFDTEEEVMAQIG